MKQVFKGKKLYVVRKYIWATSAAGAIAREKDVPVDDAWVDEEWRKKQSDKPEAIGFLVEEPEE